MKKQLKGGQANMKRLMQFGVAVPLLAGIMFLSGCATSPKVLVNFEQATSMSREDALKVVNSIVRDGSGRWAYDPYVYPAGWCSAFQGYDRNAHIKVSWEDLYFRYIPAPLEIPSQFALFHGSDMAHDKSCSEGSGAIFVHGLDMDGAKRLATALTALGAKPN